MDNKFYRGLHKDHFYRNDLYEQKQADEQKKRVAIFSKTSKWMINCYVCKTFQVSGSILLGFKLQKCFGDFI